MHDRLLLSNTMRVRLNSMYRIARSATPYEIGWKVLIYYMVLVGVTDCLLWYSAGTLGGYTWQYLVTYSLMAYPLWMFIALKGVAKEQVDLSEMSKWFAVDLLVGGSTVIFIGHYIGKTLKNKALYVWYLLFVILAIRHGADAVVLLLATLNMMLGAINLTLAGIVTKMYAPKGYSSIISSIFFNVTWIMSGAVFPLGMISDSALFYILNPFSAAISTPLSIVGEPNTGIGAFSLQLYTFYGAVIWLIILALVAVRAERSQREKFYQ